MKINRSQIARSVARDSLTSGLSHKQIQSLAKYLLESRRTGEVNSIVRDIQAEWANAGRVVVSVSSVNPLSSEVRSDIKDQIRTIYEGAKTIIITESIDPNLVGGIKIETAEKELDLSVRTKLNNLRQLINKRD